MERSERQQRSLYWIAIISLPNGGMKLCHSSLSKAIDLYSLNFPADNVLAQTFGPRTNETCRELLTLLKPFNIGMITSDDWGSYARKVPKEKHLTGNIFTQRIERNNLTLRTRIKRLAQRTICFSRSVELHEKVIGALIEKYMFY
ncbi:insertion element IS1 protein InsB [Serratia marcescens]|uniref:Insertion element IS1 protein InsB n=3 Tax=Serratia TaxID=613 RepID=A0AA46QE48_SERMA|nr:insertion element IS1 protein InsB [Serratia marcescens]